jgi:putative DNA primase/helicase
VGPSEYLGRKRVGAHGLLFPRCSVLIGIDDQAQRVDVWAGEEVSRYFADLPKPRPEHISFMLIKRGSIVLPLRDAVGAVWSLQVIQPNGTKLFPKYGRKSGLWHLLGETVEAPVVAIAEGYATAASIHEAMGWPVAVALDAGNLQRVAGYLRLLYPDSQMVVCGDDDPEVTNNPGRLKAQEAANTVGGVAVFPRLGEVA